MSSRSEKPLKGTDFSIMQNNGFTPMPLDTLELDPGIFRAYDIRGITSTNLTDQVCYGSVEPSLLKPSAIPAPSGHRPHGRLSSQGLNKR